MTTVAQAAPSTPAAPPAWAGYLVVALAVAAAVIAAVLVDATLGAPNASLVFVLPVVLAAASFGWRPALAASIAGAIAYNFFLIEPRFTLRVADPGNAWALCLLLVTGAIVSAVAAQARRRAVLAAEAAERAGALQALARALVGATSKSAIAACCAEAVGQIFRAPAVVLLDDGEGLAVRGRARGAQLSAADLDAARLAIASRRATRGGAYPAGEAEFDFWPVDTRSREAAAIGVRPGNPDVGRPEASEPLIQIVEGYLAVALDRETYAEHSLRREVETAGEKLKADLLAAVSHDLKTPLSTIVFTLQSLRRFEHDANTRGELLQGAEAEAARLASMVENLLDMSRMEAGAVQVRKGPEDPATLVAAGLARAEAALRDRRVRDEVTGGQRLLVDAALFETALANILENAGRYSPPGSQIVIRNGEDGEMGWLEVVDQGPGFDQPAEALFARFARGHQGDGRPPGTGLGLSIAKSFMEAQGGRLEAANREDGVGAQVRLLAPLAGAAQ